MAIQHIAYSTTLKLMILEISDLLPDSCNPIKISSTMWLLYWD